MAGNFEEVATQFVTFYYQTFDGDRAQLGSLYRPNSMLTFENAQCQGTDAIIEKLTSLPFTKVKHEVTTLNAQPASDGGAILVSVTGRLLDDGQDRPMSYCQVFHLLPDAGSYYVFNDIFNLVYAAA